MAGLLTYLVLSNARSETQYCIQTCRHLFAFDRTYFLDFVHMSVTCTNPLWSNTFSILVSILIFLAPPSSLPYDAHRNSSLHLPIQDWSNVRVHGILVLPRLICGCISLILVPCPAGCKESFLNWIFVVYLQHLPGKEETSIQCLQMAYSLVDSSCLLAIRQKCYIQV